MRKLDKFDIMPHTKPIEFKKAFEIAKEKWSGKKLSLIGHDGVNIYFQETGNTEEFMYPLSLIR